MYYSVYIPPLQRHDSRTTLRPHVTCAENLAMFGFVVSEMRPHKLCMFHFPCATLYNEQCKKGKGIPYSITERRVPELIPVLCSQPAGNVSHKPGGRTDSHLFTGTHYFLPGLQLPSQPLTGLLPISLHGEQKHDGCEQFA